MRSEQVRDVVRPLGYLLGLEFRHFGLHVNEQILVSLGFHDALFGRPRTPRLGDAPLRVASHRGRKPAASEGLPQSPAGPSFDAPRDLTDADRAKLLARAQKLEAAQLSDFGAEAHPHWDARQADRFKYAGEDQHCASS